MKPLSIVVAQSNAKAAESLVRSLYNHFRLVNVARNVNELRHSIPRHRADVAVVDLELAALAEIQELRKEFGATTFVCEYAPDKRRGFFASFLDMGSYLGFALGAAIVSVLQLSLGQAAMEEWGWRLPFLIAGPLSGQASSASSANRSLQIPSPMKPNRRYGKWSFSKARSASWANGSRATSRP